MKNNYDLLNGLFTGQKKSGGTVQDENRENTTKRTFKISNKHWEDFIALTALKGKTQAEMINAFIQQAVEENQEEIARFKEIVKR